MKRRRKLRRGAGEEGVEDENQERSAKRRRRAVRLAEGDGAGSSAPNAGGEHIPPPPSPWQDEEAEDGTEGRSPRIRQSPKKPSWRLITEHMKTHVPFRNWCKYCVAGRGRNDPHMQGKAKEHDSEVQLVAMDYCYMIDDPVDERRNTFFCS